MHTAGAPKDCVPYPVRVLISEKYSQSQGKHTVDMLVDMRSRDVPGRAGAPCFHAHARSVLERLAPSTILRACITLMAHFTDAVWGRFKCHGSSDAPLASM